MVEEHDLFGQNFFLVQAQTFFSGNTQERKTAITGTCVATCMWTQMVSFTPEYDMSSHSFRRSKLPTSHYVPSTHRESQSKGMTE